jgi:hypothetical protein
MIVFPLICHLISYFGSFLLPPEVANLAHYILCNYKLIFVLYDEILV